ncbi:MAG: hypothetical protein GY838_03050 [bacterium]|nr:hypothetical protein [bacterium]
MNFSGRRAATVAVLVVLASSGCAATAPEPMVVRPVMLELGGPLAGREAEVSGLTWHEGDLFLLPQFPDRYGEPGVLTFFRLPGVDLAAAVADEHSGALVPEPVTCEAPWLVPLIHGYDGLESTCVFDDLCFMTVEAERDTAMAGFLVAARFTGEDGAVSMTMERLTSIPLAVQLPNMSQETIIQDGRRIVTINEANGANVNAAPVAHVFGLDLAGQGTIPFPSVEYRVTDATDLDTQGRFWVLNYFWPPDGWFLRPAADPEVARFGAPPWLEPGACVERLLELQLLEDRIVRTNRPPLWLEPRRDGDCRNWEAVARFGEEGFILVTDKYPATLMAYVPLPGP